MKKLRKAFILKTTRKGSIKQNYIVVFKEDGISTTCEIWLETITPSIIPSVESDIEKEMLVRSKVTLKSPDEYEKAIGRIESYNAAMETLINRELASIEKEYAERTAALEEFEMIMDRRSRSYLRNGR